jgi:predicted PurR-regulated permease PerM
MMRLGVPGAPDEQTPDAQTADAQARETLLATSSGSGTGACGAGTAEAEAPTDRAANAVLVAPPPTAIALSATTLWSAAGVAVAVIAITVAVVKTFDFLLLIFFAITLAEAMRPAVDAMARRRVPRVAGVLLIYLGSALALALVLWLLLAPLPEQLSAMQRDLPRRLEALQHLGARAQQAIGARADLAQVVASVERSAASDTAPLAQRLISIPAAALSVPFALFVILSVALFWLTGATCVRPSVLGLVPARERGRAARVMDELGRDLGGYTRGLVVNTILVGGLTWLGLLFLGVPYPLLLGLATGLLQLVPLIGPWISGAMVALTALASVGGPRAAATVLVFFLVQQLDGAVIAPLITSRSARLNPIATLIATIIGGALLGFFGAVMAVPLAIVGQVVMVRILVPWVHTRAPQQQQTFESERVTTDQPTGRVPGVSLESHRYTRSRLHTPS